MNTLQKINLEYEKMQANFGDNNLHCIVGGGCTTNPNVCMVFMNPTAKNIASSKIWTGPRWPWLGTKDVWKFLNKLQLISDKLLTQINSIKPSEWSIDFCNQVYEEVENNGLYITNLAKCTLPDARQISDAVFKEYVELFKKEIDAINPKVIILFGNQVSSVVLRQKISVSTCRLKPFELKTHTRTYPCYCVYYPVGNGRFNQDKAIEDLTQIL